MMKKYLTKKQVEQIFKEEFKDILTKKTSIDWPMRSMAWIDFCDSLNKSGEISDHAVRNWYPPKCVYKQK